MSKPSVLTHSRKVPEKLKRYGMTVPGLLKMGLSALEMKYYLRRIFLLPIDEVHCPSQD